MLRGDLPGGRIGRGIAGPHSQPHRSGEDRGPPESRVAIRHGPCVAHRSPLPSLLPANGRKVGLEPSARLNCRRTTSHRRALDGQVLSNSLLNNWRPQEGDAVSRRSDSRKNEARRVFVSTARAAILARLTITTGELQAGSPEQSYKPLVLTHRIEDGVGWQEVDYAGVFFESALQPIQHLFVIGES